MHDVKKQTYLVARACALCRLRHSSLLATTAGSAPARKRESSLVEETYVSLGSCAELETQIEVSSELNYLSREKAQLVLEVLDHESRMLQNLIKRL